MPTLPTSALGERCSPWLRHCPRHARLQEPRDFHSIPISSWSTSWLLECGHQPGSLSDFYGHLEHILASLWKPVDQPVPSHSFKSSFPRGPLKHLHHLVHVLIEQSYVSGSGPQAKAQSSSVVGVPIDTNLVCTVSVNPCSPCTQPASLLICTAGQHNTRHCGCRDEKHAASTLPIPSSLPQSPSPSFQQTRN